MSPNLIESSENKKIIQKNPEEHPHTSTASDLLEMTLTTIICKASYSLPAAPSDNSKQRLMPRRPRHSRVSPATSHRVYLRWLIVSPKFPLDFRPCRSSRIHSPLMRLGLGKYDVCRLARIALPKFVFIIVFGSVLHMLVYVLVYFHPSCRIIDLKWNGIAVVLFRHFFLV